MRLNRGTLILLVISLLVIIAVIVVNNNNLLVTATTATPTFEAGGPLFADLSADNILSLKVTNTSDDSVVELARDDASAAWTVSGTAADDSRTVDQDKAATAANNVATLQAVTGFAGDGENLADFGLDAPAFTVEVTTTDDNSYTLNVGGQNPGSSRYYVQPGDKTDTVYLVVSSSVTAITNLVAVPPYTPLPTATATATATLNPLSEVEQATATMSANMTVTAVIGTLDAESTAEATPEVTATP